jgi:hypothetical protein
MEKLRFGGKIMASEAQIKANRENAQKSTGPRTEEGKAVVAQNAVKHGLLARAAVLQGEDWEEYTCFHEQMIEELYPDGMQERELAERIVGLYWRLRRAERYQNAVFEALYDKYAAEGREAATPADAGPSVPSDPVLGRMLLADFSGDRVLERVLLYERRIESSLHRVCADLQQLRRQPARSARRGGASLDGRWADSEGDGRDRRDQGDVSSWKGQVSRGQGPAAPAPASNAALAPWEPGSEFDLAWRRNRAWNPPTPPLPDRLPSPAVPVSAQPASAGGTNVPEAAMKILSLACQDAQAAEDRDG